MYLTTAPNDIPTRSAASRRVVAGVYDGTGVGSGVGTTVGLGVSQSQPVPDGQVALHCEYVSDFLQHISVDKQHPAGPS